MAIGLSCTHLHADFTSVATLFKSWTEVHRKQPIEHLPIFERPLPGDQPKCEISQQTLTQYYENKSRAATPTVKMATATFSFSNSILQKCVKELQDRCPGATSFDFLTALFWICIDRLKDPKDSSKRSLSVCIDSRKFLNPPLPFGYFGNALHFSQLSLDADEMHHRGIADVARPVHDHVANLREEEFWSAWEWFKSRKSASGSPVQMYGPELTCVNMEHLPVDKMVLCNGLRPVHVSCNISNIGGEGLIVITPSSEEGQFARTVMVALPKGEVDKLCEDQEILKFEPRIVLRRRK